MKMFYKIDLDRLSYSELFALRNACSGTCDYSYIHSYILSEFRLSRMTMREYKNNQKVLKHKIRKKCIERRKKDDQY